MKSIKFKLKNKKIKNKKTLMQTNPNFKHQNHNIVLFLLKDKIVHIEN